MTFASRQSAGDKLGSRLIEQGVDVDIVLGLPRGGVIVAAEVARLMQRPLNALVVRKIGHPLNREYAVGALAEGGVEILDDSAITFGNVTRQQLAEVFDEENQRLLHYETMFHGGEQVDLNHKRVLLVDDGLATGATADAAVLSARRRGAEEVIVAAPVASKLAIARLAGIADRTLVLLVDPRFHAVGAYYESFSQVTDEEVVTVLRSHQVIHGY